MEEKDILGSSEILEIEESSCLIKGGGGHMIANIIKELKAHSPFTLFGAMTGVIFMMIFKRLPHDVSYNVFYVLHPAHVFLSAVVTTALYCQYASKTQKNRWTRFFKILAIGYVGSVGVGTLSDSLIPFFGEKLLEMHHAEVHIGFIEKWWIVNPLAFAGVLYGYFWHQTKYPHTLHVLLSTWASLFHMMMAQDSVSMESYFGVFIFLFLAVWLPCCFSDIVFPLMFIKDKDVLKKYSCTCGHS